LTSTLAFWTAHFCVHTCKPLEKKIIDQDKTIVEQKDMIPKQGSMMVHLCKNKERESEIEVLYKKINELLLLLLLSLFPSIKKSIL
jgi:hypothetical protein